MARKRQLDQDDLAYEMEYSRRGLGTTNRPGEDNDWNEEVGLEAAARYPELASFFDEGLITEVLYEVKSGKEATVYCCQAGLALGGGLVAAKIYRPRENRNFKNDTMYQEGFLILDQRAKRAVKNKSDFGRQAGLGIWVNREFAYLTQLHKIGAAVPQPLRQTERAILMEYRGDHDGAAPLLNAVSLEPQQARPLFEFMMYNVELWLKHDLVHGDLSPFNVLYWEGQLTVIDFPQAVDPRFNPHALRLLERDIDNLCRYWQRQGLAVGNEAGRIAGRLWKRFQNSQL